VQWNKLHQRASQLEALQPQQRDLSETKHTECRCNPLLPRIGRGRGVPLRHLVAWIGVRAH